MRRGCPRLAGEGKAGHTEIRAHLVVDLGLSELVEVAEELEHVGAAAEGRGERGAVVA